MKLTFVSRIFLGFFAIMAVATWFLFNNLVDQIKPVMRQAVEFTLVDTANLLAEMAAPQLERGEIDVEFFQAFLNSQNRQLDVSIWGHAKDKISLQVYITDDLGKVLFDSSGRYTGEDFSQWRDVYLTLRGDYGARSSQEDYQNPLSSVMHVAAPIYAQGSIIGSLTVYTPNLSMQPYLEAARQNVLVQGSWLLLATAIIGGLLSYWLSTSVTKLVRYADNVKSGQATKLPKLQGSELNRLASAIDDMRVKLEGKAYVENYVQSLTHELKSPVAAIGGAAEMLMANPPEQIKQQFLTNIREQSARLTHTIEQMLRLAHLENNQHLLDFSSVDLALLTQEVLSHKQAKADLKQLTFKLNLSSFSMQGSQQWLQVALENIVDNAIEFSPELGQISVSLTQQHEELVLAVCDQGSGIPDYALDKVFDRFYSLPRPNGGSKSTGLGLSFVQQIMVMHQGSVELENSKQGLMVRLVMPL